MKKKEILFLWDGENWNPNGDMLRDNAPRFDEISEIAEVTDVRIKRTIRDEIMKSNPDSIFVKKYMEGDSVLDAKGAIRTVIDVKGKSKEEIIKEVLSKFIDLRAFGGLIPITGSKDKIKDKKKKDKEEPNDEQAKDDVSDVNFTGPVQFRISKSLHKVEIEEIQGTGAFASRKDSGNKTFRIESILKYAVFATYGIIDNYNAAKTNFSEEDETKILKSLWYGTKNLISRSKMGQIPRFMLIITYKDDTFAGDLNNSISLKSEKEDKAIRSINEYTVDFTNLKNKLARYASNIEKIEYMSDYDFETINKENFDSSWKKIEA